MLSTGSNAVKVGSFNQTVVLDAIRRSDSISRIEISQRTGLVPQTVTNITRRLINDGLVVEAGKSATGLGKPRTLIRLNPLGKVAIGVHLDPAVTSLALLDLTGKVLNHRRFTTPSATDPAHVIAVIAEAVSDTISISSTDRERILGVGIGAPGPVDLKAGIVDSPPHLPHWHRVPLRDELSRVTGLPVILAKDVIAASVAETWHSPSLRRDTTVVIYVGAGIGVGASIQGEVVRGASGNSGDVAHIVVDDGDDAEKCRCGRRGCVTVTASPTALVRRARQSGISLPEESTAAALTALFTAEAQGDARAAALISTAVTGLARMALVVTDLYDADRLVFGGAFWSRYRDAFDRIARTTLLSAPIAHPIHSIEITESILGDEMGAIGAAILLLDRYLSPHRDTLTFATP